MCSARLKFISLDLPLGLWSCITRPDPIVRSWALPFSCEKELFRKKCIAFKTVSGGEVFFFFQKNFAAFKTFFDITVKIFFKRIRLREVLEDGHERYTSREKGLCLRDVLKEDNKGYTSR